VIAGSGPLREVAAYRLDHEITDRDDALGERGSPGH